MSVHLQHDGFKDLQASTFSRRLQAWSRDRLLVTLFLCQLLFFGALVGFAWKVGSHRYTGSGDPHHSVAAAHDDPVSAARRHALRTADPQQPPPQQQQLLGGSGFAAVSQQRQQLGAAPATDQRQPQGGQQQQQAQQPQQQAVLPLQQTGGVMPDISTLVLYIFSPTDPEYLNNLMYFIREGIKADDGCDYIIVVNQASGKETVSFSAMSNMAGNLPPNARYVTHKNECYDWGTLGWLLTSERVDTSRYKYVLFINSSVRGPFLPAYWPKSVHWTRVFTDRINNSTKLVGPTISCEGIQPVDYPEERKNPHVQSFVVATDQTGLKLLMDDGEVFKCYNHIHLTMYHSELGASRAIMNAGYTIDCLMTRYQGVDWRDQAQWHCNADESPYKESHYDGINVDPLEVLFVKVKEPLLELRYGASLKAEKYDAWSQNAAAAAASLTPKQRDVTSNAYHQLPPDFRTVVLTADGKSATGKCFNVPYYKHYSPELEPLEDRIALQHFAARGQFEGRHFKFEACK